MLTIRPKIRRLCPCLDDGRGLVVGDLGGIPQFSWGMKLVEEQHKDLELMVEDKRALEEDMPRLLAVEGMKLVVVDILLKFN